MKIGIDISQMAYEGTGVGNFVTKLVEGLLTVDSDNDYVLFYSSLRRKFLISNFKFLISKERVTIREFKFPPTVLDLLWNRLHVLPVEWLIGDVDVFISSDWTQPPTKKAKKVTILYDLIVYKHPEETAKKIVETQKRRLEWVKKECEEVICISEATKKDARDILGIEESKLRVVYPGI
jgi:hypothetical protein